ncbi:hypothetical protein PACTADRAFT_50966 [Pachysolen tannophilus NRRL Y-2460]|uniref:Uncharacterized protein n=1 Tax=Pachysolen tannophilus NRRL Y-2460 TaxID=669874 RepID=A0A1E4TQQ3_PACTA|nr:hypothetical protein PACTADRAFT_50966 [Pachysolen tannophilus NRRL Y-2460]
MIRVVYRGFPSVRSVGSVSAVRVSVGGVGIFNNNILFSSSPSSCSVRFNSTEKTSLSSTKSKSSNTIGNQPSITKIGIPAKLYIPPRISRLPNPFLNPVRFMKCIFKRLGLVGLNTLQVIDFRKGGLKPEFILWKNLAIEKFVHVNKAFAQRKLQTVRSECSSFVFDALKNRSKTLPKDVELDWKLIKFNSKPKLLSFYHFPTTDGATLCLQIVYKFDTKQRLVFVKNGETTNQDKDLIEYLAFNVDPYTKEVCIAGSLFESGIDEKISPEASPSQRTVLNNMVEFGDIYRIEPPRDLPKKIESSKN